MKIAAICAFPSKHNTGMLTVDLALHSFAHRMQIISVDMFNIEIAYEAPGSQISHRKLSDIDQLEGYDYIFFWGDFLHCRAYYTKDVLRRSVKYHGSSIDLSTCYKYLLLNSADERLQKKSIIFGGSLYLNGVSDQLDKPYMDSIKRLYTNAPFVMARDPISAQYASRYGHGRPETLGVDAAFLLKPTPSFSWSQKTGKIHNRVGFSFGRGLSKVEKTKQEMMSFVGNIADELGTSDVVDIQWLVADKRDPVSALKRKLDRICSCDIIITDTYHCAVNAWREGVPAICIGSGAEIAVNTLSDKKKEILYQMFGIREFFVYAESITDKKTASKIADRIISVFSDLDSLDAMKENILRQTQFSEDRLARMLS